MNADPRESPSETEQEAPAADRERGGKDILEPPMSPPPDARRPNPDDPDEEIRDYEGDIEDDLGDSGSDQRR